MAKVVDCLPDNTAVFQLFSLSDDQPLDSFLSKCQRVVQSHVSAYIWHYDEWSLLPHPNNGMLLASSFFISNLSSHFVTQTRAVQQTTSAVQWHV
jgi:hypothetical protein